MPQFRQSEIPSLVVWGRNQLGQLGIEPQTAAVVKNPVSVSLERLFARSCRQQVRQVACGKAHTVLLVQIDGQPVVVTFGSNRNGQLGIGKNVSANVDPSTVNVNNVFQVACAKNSTFAINDQGRLFSWGSSKDGVLGLPQSADLYSPQQVPLPGEAVQISAGKSHVGLLLRDLLLYTWGSNKYGQLGLGSYESTSEPAECLIKGGPADESSDTLTVSVRDQSPVEVACGDTFTVVRTMNGTVYSCGSNI